MIYGLFGWKEKMREKKMERKKIERKENEERIKRKKIRVVLKWYIYPYYNKK